MALEWSYYRERVPNQFKAIKLTSENMAEVAADIGGEYVPGTPEEEAWEGRILEHIRFTLGDDRRRVAGKGQYLIMWKERWHGKVVRLGMAINEVDLREEFMPYAVD